MNPKATIAGLFFIVLHLVVKPQDTFSKGQLVDKLDSLFEVGVAEELIPGGFIAMVTSDSLLLNKAYGYSDLDKKIMATDTTLFQVGSVGKVFTSIAVLQLVEKSRLDLDKDVNHYLQNWELGNPFPTSVNLRSLLTHSAGFNERIIGYQARSNDLVEPLGEHLKKRMPSLFQSPGIEINYSNYSYGLAGYLVELQSSKTYEQYINEAILDSLQMKSSTLFLPDDYEQNGLFAKGYRNTNQGFQFMKNYPRNISPAGGILLSCRDAVPFAKELLKREGLLSSSVFDDLFVPQFKVHPSLTGYSFAFEEQLYNGQQFWMKGGQVQGALAFLLVFPNQDLAIFHCVNTQTDNFSSDLNRLIKRILLPEMVGSILPEDSKNTTNLEQLTGTYRLNRYNRETIEDFISLFMNPLKVSLSENGRLKAYLHQTYQEFEKRSDGAFYGIKDPNVKLVFKEINGEWRLYTDYYFAGFTVPASYKKLPFYETPIFVDKGYPWLLTPMMSYPVVLFWIGIVWVVRKWKPDFLNNQTINISHHAPLILFLLLTIFDVAYFLVPLLKDPYQLLFGLPQAFVNVKYLHLFMLLISLLVVIKFYNVLRRRLGSLVSRMYFGLFSFSALFYLYFLYRWHFLSMAN